MVIHGYLTKNFLKITKTLPILSFRDFITEKGVENGTVKAISVLLAKEVNNKYTNVFLKIFHTIFLLLK